MQSELEASVSGKAKHFEGERRAHQAKMSDFDHNVDSHYPPHNIHSLLTRYSLAAHSLFTIHSPFTIRQR